MEPEISVAKVVNLSAKDIKEILELVHSKEEIINTAWEKHFENK